MGTRTHRMRRRTSRQDAPREIAWTIRSVLETIIRAGIRQPELVPVRVDRDPRYR